MKIVAQRVSRASVTVDGKITGQIGPGLLLLVGFRNTDTLTQAEVLAKKCVELRVFEDETEKMNLSLQETKGELLVISQFTLYGDCRKGRRPSYSDAAPGEKAKVLYEKFVGMLQVHGLKVATGIFGADMKVELLNDGPVTLLLEAEARTEVPAV
jgi:D-tyrosyl-tRNA(Tyr) deacylase